jgi:hypothetical protein
MSETAIDYLAAQIWRRIDASDVLVWRDVAVATRQRYQQYVRDIILKEEAL